MWDTAVGNSYKTVIDVDLALCKNIVEFAPGKRFKTINAIRGTSFKGNLYVVDGDKEACEFVKRQYPSIVTSAKINVICDSLFSHSNKLPKEIDLFIANHPFDDMILYELAIRFNEKDIFSFNDENKISELWFKINDDKELQEEILDKIYDNWVTLFKKSNIKKLIICQYISNRYSAPHKDVADKITYKLFSKIKALTDSNNVKIGERLNRFKENSNEDIKVISPLLDCSAWIYGKVIL